MTKKETTSASLAIIENFKLPILDEEIGQAMSEEMDGLTLSFPRVKIPSGGGLAFEIPGDDPENPDMEKEIIGIIVDHHPVNAYWQNRYSGANNPPDCSSIDGKVGVDQNGNRRSCNSCPNNNWGTAEDGRGKACKNMHRIYILREGEMLPLLLTLPPTSLKNLSDYLGLRIVSKGLRSYGVITKVSLKKVQNAGGIDYSQAVFTLVGKLSPEQIKAMAEYSRGIKVLTRQLAIGADEYMQESAKEKIEEAEDDEEEMPF
ncbi:hypothetical protein [Thermosyntropha sp.]|uniref:hypothetical protein n=1 Tax=Thermosyntropha sp. TaxID=2740820 RepID=UPI0025FECB67|nr:hypothetical protein [Thermosyntropha sp.]MBO8158847.1 hypothetical protein [Thermosyntropha sp.]